MKVYQRNIIFSKIQLTGFYKYKDIFQIFPADFKGMPESPFQKDYPNIIEYWYDDKKMIPRESEYESLKKLFSETATTITQLEKVLSLLNAFSNNLFFRYENIQGIWATPILFHKETGEVSEEVNYSSSQWCSPSFHFPTLPSQFQITDFTPLQLPQIKRMGHLQFYTRFPNLDQELDKEIVFSDKLDEILDAYFSFDQKTKDILDSAVGHTNSAIELIFKKRTLALLAAFTALETLIDLEFRNMETELCEQCGQLKFSVSRKFREFLLKYIGDSSHNKKKFNSYYKLRSKIVHTGVRLKSEKLFSEFPKDELDDEYVLRLEILQIGKLALANWLLLNRT